MIMQFSLNSSAMAQLFALMTKFLGKTLNREGKRLKLGWAIFDIFLETV